MENPKESTYVSFASEILTYQNCEQVEQELVNSAPNGKILWNSEPKISVISSLLYPLVPISEFQYLYLKSNKEFEKNFFETWLRMRKTKQCGMVNHDCYTALSSGNWMSNN